MRRLSAILWILLLFPACNQDPDPDDDDSADPDPVFGWDEEADEILCAIDTVDAPLLEEAITDAGLADHHVGYTESDWGHGSYSPYLNDTFLLEWFYEFQWEPLYYPCLGGQAAADLDHAAETAHPVATALGEAMALLNVPGNLDPIDPDDSAQELADLSSLPADLAEALTPILDGMARLADAHDTFADDAPESVHDLVLYGHGGLITGGRGEPELTDVDVQEWVISDTGPRVLYDPARVLTFAIEHADLLRFAGTDATLDVETELGRVVVAGPGDDDPGELGAVALYLDLGGNDTYVHPAGANTDEVPIGVHIDLGGDDRYGYVETDEGTDALLPSDAQGRDHMDTYYGNYSESTTGRQGSGRAGVGLLFDLGGGNDHYQSLRVSQGWGHVGVGVLYDDGGDDIYLGEEGVQGAAAMGIGLLMDEGQGDDTHRTYHYSQGFAWGQAAGIAWDGGGADSWYANPGKEADGGTTLYPSPQLPDEGNSSFCQGVGFGLRADSASTFLSGGVGILRDVGGDDVYTAGTFAQGSGYWQGIGLLVDGGGADQYDAYYYVQGGAAHYAAGVLLDDGPEDDRINTNMAPNYMMVGAGHDMSVGVLVNEGGNDTYVYGGLAGGASNCQGVGLFVDNDGADLYQISSAYSTGLGNHSGECNAIPRTMAPSIGLFLDSGGDTDTYEWPGGDHPAPADGTSFGYAQNGSATEYGGAVDGDGETGIHASGVAP